MKREDFVIDYDLSKLDDAYWKRAEARRIAREIADEADAEDNGYEVENEVVF